MISAKHGKVWDISTVIESNIRVCTYTELEDEIMAKYPGLITVPHALGVDCFNAMDNGECGAIIVSDVDGDLSLGNPKHCDKIAVGRSLLTYALAVPVAAKYQAIVSWMVMKGVSAGKYESAKQAAMRQYKSIGACTSRKGPDLATFAGQLDVEDLAGPMLISLFCSALGVSMFFLREVERELAPVVTDKITSLEPDTVLENVLSSAAQVTCSTADALAHDLDKITSFEPDNVLENVLSSAAQATSSTADALAHDLSHLETLASQDPLCLHQLQRGESIHGSIGSFFDKAPDEARHIRRTHVPVSSLRAHTEA
jgi:hypothetical protein